MTAPTLILPQHVLRLLLKLKQPSHPTSQSRALPLMNLIMILKMKRGWTYWMRPLMMDVSFISLERVWKWPLMGRPAFFALTGYVGDEVRILRPPEERLRCVACRRPILVPTLDIGHHPILWRLAHCHHPLHLDCLAPLGQPYAISGVTQRPRYAHNPGSFFFSLLT